jgi:hypothetical protein
MHTLRHLGRYSGTSLPVAALLASPLLFVSLAQWASFGRGRIDARWIFVWISILLVSLFTASVWLQAAIIKATRDFRQGEQPGIVKTLTGSLPQTLKLLGAMILIGILFLGAAVAGSVPLLGVVLIGIAGPGPAEFDGPLLVLLILAILIGLAIFGFLAAVIFFRYAMAPAAAVLERRSPLNALERSRTIMQRRWVDFFLLTLMVWVVTIAIQVVVGTPAFLVSFSGSTEGGGFGANNPLSMFLNPPRIGFAAALVTAVSTYLVQVAAPIVANGARANFFLDVTEEVSETASVSPRGDDVTGAGPAADDEGDAGEKGDRAGEDEGAGNLAEQ